MTIQATNLMGAGLFCISNASRQSYVYHFILLMPQKKAWIGPAIKRVLLNSVVNLTTLTTLCMVDSKLIIMKSFFIGQSPFHNYRSPSRSEVSLSTSCSLSISLCVSRNSSLLSLIKVSINVLSLACNASTARRKLSCKKYSPQRMVSGWWKGFTRSLIGGGCFSS